jgi:hypothetical protein
MHGSGPELDRTVPALLVKIGHYPQHAEGLGVLRTLGRLGVPVHAMVEDRFTPAAVSRYATRRFVRPTTGLESPTWTGGSTGGTGGTSWSTSTPGPGPSSGCWRRPPGWTWCAPCAWT